MPQGTRPPVRPLSLHSAMVALGALLLPGAALAGSPLSLPARTFTLENGLRVVLHADPRSPLVTVTWRVQAGAADDPPGFTGTAHLLEHMMFEGSAHVARGDFDARLEAVGGESNAWTTRDSTTYQVLVPAPALDLALFLEADRQVSPLLDPGAFENEVGVVTLEQAALEDRAHGQDPQVLADLLYPPGDPYRNPILGRAQDHANLTGNDTAIRVFFRERYTPDRAILVVAGDLDLDEAEALVRRRFSALAPRPAAARPLPVPVDLMAPGPSPRQGSGHGRGRLYVAWRVVPDAHPDAPALALAWWLLTTRGGRLDPLPGSVEAWSDLGRIGGEVGLQWDVMGSWKRGLRRIQRQVDRLGREGPTREELERAQSAWEGAWLRAVDPLPRRARILADCMESWGEPDCLARDLDRYGSVTVDDVKRVVGTWLTPRRRVALVAP